MQIIPRMWAIFKLLYTLKFAKIYTNQAEVHKCSRLILRKGVIYVVFIHPLPFSDLKKKNEMKLTEFNSITYLIH